MYKKLFSLILICLLTTANLAVAGEVSAVDKKQAKTDELNSIGNKIITSEYPDADKISPQIEDIKKVNDTKVIEGSVEKTIDITLEDCIKFA